MTMASTPWSHTWYCIRRTLSMRGREERVEARFAEDEFSVMAGEYVEMKKLLAKIVTDYVDGCARRYAEANAMEARTLLKHIIDCEPRCPMTGGDTRRRA